MVFVCEGGCFSVVWAVVGQTLWWCSLVQLANRQRRWCNARRLREVSAMIWQLDCVFAGGWKTYL
jgi:hypothetical protein